jgi:hypothetical protein
MRLFSLYYFAYNYFYICKLLSDLLIVLQLSLDHSKLNSIFRIFCIIYSNNKIFLQPTCTEKRLYFYRLKERTFLILLSLWVIFFTMFAYRVAA